MTLVTLDNSSLETDAAAKLRSRFQALLDGLSNNSKARIDRALDVVRRNPVTAVAGIFAAGMIAAALISRKAS